MGSGESIDFLPPGAVPEQACLPGGFVGTSGGNRSSNFGSADRSKSTSKANASLSCCLAVHKTLVSTACTRAPLSVRLPPDRVETLITRADQAMYHAKRRGRNRVELYNEDCTSENEPR